MQQDTAEPLDFVSIADKLIPFYPYVFLINSQEADDLFIIKTTSPNAQLCRTGSVTAQAITTHGPVKALELARDCNNPFNLTTIGHSSVVTLPENLIPLRNSLHEEATRQFGNAEVKYAGKIGRVVLALVQVTSAPETKGPNRHIRVQVISCSFVKDFPTLFIDKGSVEQTLRMSTQFEFLTDIPFSSWGVANLHTDEMFLRHERWQIIERAVHFNQTLQPYNVPMQVICNLHSQAHPPTNLLQRICLTGMKYIRNAGGILTAMPFIIRFFVSHGMCQQKVIMNTEDVLVNVDFNPVTCLLRICIILRGPPQPETHTLQVKVLSRFVSTSAPVFYEPFETVPVTPIPANKACILTSNNPSSPIFLTAGTFFLSP